jgi:Uncharacterized membrane protein
VPTKEKAIRSTGWKTDFLIGFPDGLFLLFFATLLIQALQVSVQQFYDLIIWVSLAGAVLVMITSWLANRGDPHDESTLSPQERKKLHQLDITRETIEHMEQEIAQDASRWANTLQQEKVQTVSWHPLRAVRSSLVAGICFLAGALIPCWPYFANENFSASSRLSSLLVFLSATLFGFIKARITGQRLWIVIFRYLLLTAGIWLAVYLVRQVLIEV